MHGSHGLSVFIKYISYLGNSGIIWIVLCLILLIFRKTRYAGFMLGVALVIDVLVVNAFLKNIVNRDRPWTEYEPFKDFYESIGLSLPSDSSFPSGHAASSCCAAVVLIVKFKWKSIPGVILAVLITLSRLYLCVHYPTDIIGGVLIGIACGVLGCVITHFVSKAILKKINKKRTESE